MDDQFSCSIIANYISSDESEGEDSHRDHNWKQHEVHTIYSPIQNLYPTSKWDELHRTTSTSTAPVPHNSHSSMPNLSQVPPAKAHQLDSSGQTTTLPGQEPHPQSTASELALTVKPRPLKYALSKSELPQPLTAFMDELRLYFLKEVNLQRNRGPISPTTMDKAEERLFCKYIDCFFIIYIKNTCTIQT